MLENVQRLFDALEQTISKLAAAASSAGGGCSE
jgi:hypothetical protein